MIKICNIISRLANILYRVITSLLQDISPLNTNYNNSPFFLFLFLHLEYSRSCKQGIVLLLESKQSVISVTPLH